MLGNMLISRRSRLVWTLALAALVGFLWPATGNAASIKTYSERLLPEAGNDGVITVRVTGSADTAGEALFVPISWAKASTTAQGWKSATLNGLKGFTTSLPFAGQFDVSVSLKVPGLFAAPATAGSDEGPSYRADAIDLKHTFTAPYDVDGYELTLLLPQGSEIFAVTLPAKHTLIEQDSLKGLKVAIKGSAANPAIFRGSQMKLEIQHITPGTLGMAVMWLCAIGISLVWVRSKKNLVTGG